MSKTLTIRLAEDLDRALARRAKTLGKTKSELVRDLINVGLEEKPIGGRIRPLKGTLDIPRTTNAWQRRIKERNWR